MVGSRQHPAVLPCRFTALCQKGGYLSEYEMYFAYMFSFHRHARSLALVAPLRLIP